MIPTTLVAAGKYYNVDPETGVQTSQIAKSQTVDSTVKRDLRIQIIIMAITVFGFLAATLGATAVAITTKHRTTRDNAIVLDVFTGFITLVFAAYLAHLCRCYKQIQ